MKSFLSRLIILLAICQITFLNFTIASPSQNKVLVKKTALVDSDLNEEEQDNEQNENNSTKISTNVVSQKPVLTTSSISGAENTIIATGSNNPSSNQIATQTKTQTTSAPVNSTANTSNKIVIPVTSTIATAANQAKTQTATAPTSSQAKTQTSVTTVANTASTSNKTVIPVTNPIAITGGTNQTNTQSVGSQTATSQSSTQSEAQTKTPPTSSQSAASQTNTQTSVTPVASTASTSNKTAIPVTSTIAITGATNQTTSTTNTQSTTQTAMSPGTTQTGAAGPTTSTTTSNKKSFKELVSSDPSTPTPNPTDVNTLYKTGICNTCSLDGLEYDPTQLASGVKLTSLTGSSLQSAKFTGLTLTSVDMTKTSLNNADFSNTILNNVLFMNADLTSSNFSNSRINGSNFEGTNLTNATFFINASGIIFDNPTFSDCTLFFITQIDSKPSYIRNANIKGNIYIPNTTNFTLSGTTYNGADLPITNNSLVATNQTCSNYSSFNNGTQTNVNIEKLNSTGKCIGCMLDYLQISSITNTNITDLSGSSIQNAYLPNINLSNTNLTNTNFTNTNLTSAQIISTNLTSAQIISTNPKDTNLTNTNFTNATLTGAMISSANATNVIFDGATFDNCSLLVINNMNTSTFNKTILAGAITINKPDSATITNLNTNTSMSTIVKSINTNITNVAYSAPVYTYQISAGIPIVVKQPVSNTCSGINANNNQQILQTQVGITMPELQYLLNYGACYNCNLDGLQLTPVQIQSISALSNKNKTYLEISGSSLQEAQFPGFNVDGLSQAMVFANSDLTSADLSDITAANNAIILDGSNLTGANLSKVVFGGPASSANGTNFTNANLSGANLSNMSLAGANFAGSTTSLENATLQSITTGQNNPTGPITNFTGVNMQGAVLNGNNSLTANFDNANLINAIISTQASPTTIKGSSFKNANLTSAIIENVTTTSGLIGNVTASTDFTGADLTDATITSNNVVSTIFDKTTFGNCTNFMIGSCLDGDRNKIANCESNNSAISLQNTNLNGNVLIIGVNTQANPNNINYTGSTISNNQINTDVNGDIILHKCLHATTYCNAAKTINISDDASGCNNSSTLNCDPNNSLDAAICALLTLNTTGICNNCNLQGLTLDQINLSENINITDLSGSDLSNAKLSEIDLSGVTLTNTNFTGADLSYAQFNGATDINANTQTGGINFSYANLQHADFSPDTTGKVTTMTNAAFYGADLSNANFTSAKLDGSGFGGATLSNTNFTSASLTGLMYGSTKESSSTSGTPSQGAKNGPPAPPSGSSAPEVTLIGIETAIDFNTAIFTNANLSGLILGDGIVNSVSNTSGSTINNIVPVNFSGMKIAGANFTNANLNNAMIYNTDVTGCQFGGVNFTNAKIGSNNSGMLDLTGFKFNNCTLNNTVFQNVKLAGADFTGAVINSTIFSDSSNPTSMQGAILRGLQGVPIPKDPANPANSNTGIYSTSNPSQKTSFENANMTGVILTSDNIDNTIFDNANMTNAIIYVNNFTNNSFQNVTLTNSIGIISEVKTPQASSGMINASNFTYPKNLNNTTGTNIIGNIFAITRLNFDSNSSSYYQTNPAYLMGNNGNNSIPLSVLFLENSLDYVYQEPAAGATSVSNQITLITPTKGKKCSWVGSGASGSEVCVPYTYNAPSKVSAQFYPVWNSNAGSAPTDICNNYASDIGISSSLCIEVINNVNQNGLITASTDDIFDPFDTFYNYTQDVWTYAKSSGSDYKKWMLNVDTENNGNYNFISQLKNSITADKANTSQTNASLKIAANNAFNKICSIQCFANRWPSGTKSGNTDPRSTVTNMMNAFTNVQTALGISSSACSCDSECNCPYVPPIKTYAECQAANMAAAQSGSTVVLNCSEYPTS